MIRQRRAIRFSDEEWAVFKNELGPKWLRQIINEQINSKGEAIMSPSTFDEYRVAFERQRRELNEFQAIAQAEAENRRTLAKSALEYVAGKIDASVVVDLAQGMLK